jgi:hypothetical protein
MSPCKICLHLLRERRTGPGHPVAVIRCRSHGRFFTIYPPGFVPYGRQKLPMRRAEVAPGSGAPALEAVLHAADEVMDRWPDWTDPEGNTPGWASTQWRQITRWGRWLGLTGPEGIGQQIATALGVPLHEHAAQRERYRRGTYRHRGRAIAQVLCAAGQLGGLLKRLLSAGMIAGVVGRSFLKDVQGRLRQVMPV